MQSNFYVDAKDILNATNGGLDIIFYLYPQAAGSETQKSRKFKIHEEKTASASLKKTDDGNWLVTDFGDDQQPRNGIQCFMKEKGLEYVDALRALAVQYNVVSAEKAAELIRADYSDEPAAAEDKEGTWSFEIREDDNFTSLEIETVVSKKILQAMFWQSADEVKGKAAYEKIKETFLEYHWHALDSYSFIKNRKKMTFTATDTYPMFVIDEGTHQKIYQPKHTDKGRRFLYIGEKPKDFIHGLSQLNKAYEERKKLIEEDQNDEAEEDDRSGGKSKAEKKKSKEAKLPEAILVSGGSDGLNVALMGYRVLWMNSETAKLKQWQYEHISIRVEKFYQLPDIDATGKKAAHALNMEYLDMYSIELPEELKKFKDSRGNPCKDLRDYMDRYKRKEFRLLVDRALPYRFWEKRAEYSGKGDDRKFTGYKYEFDGVQAFNFLSKNGFGRLAFGDKKTEWVYIRQVGNIIYETDADQIQDFIHDFLEERQFDKDLRNAMIYTSRLNSTSLTRLKFRNIDFTDATKESQFIFFTNYTLEITADDIIYHKPGVIDRYVWEDDVLQHRIEKPKQAPFTITKDELGTFDIVINDQDCPFLKYLVQTSRVHWREELERRPDGRTPEEYEKYCQENKFNIAGSNLTAEEAEEQKLHLVNKIFVMGFLLHRFKARNKGWFVWAQDNKINDDGKSHGGSGKSIMFDMAIRAVLKKSMTLNGRNSKLNDDQFKYDGVTEHTRYLLIDDAHEYLKLDPFYKDVSGDLNVNPKGKTPFTVPFEKSAKMAFTSNYTPRDLGPSTFRRMLPTAFSDFFHNKDESTDYLEKRDPTTDIGLTLFTDFTPEQWNSFYQVAIHALKFYLGQTEMIMPAMSNVNKRNLLAEMGNLHDWALVFFSEEAGRTDNFIVRDEAQRDYKRFNGKEITPQKFMEKLKAYCRFYGYVLNPKEYQDKNGKIIKKVEKKVYVEASGEWEVIPNSQKVTKEMLYIQAQNNLQEEEADADEQPQVVYEQVDSAKHQTNIEFNATGDDPDDDDVLPF